MNRLILVGVLVLICNFNLAHELGIAEKCADVDPIENFDLKRYEGVWYEIMRLPASFENGIKCIKGEYTLIDNRTLRVNNSGFSLTKKRFSSTIGKAQIRFDEKRKNLLTVKFEIGPFKMITKKGNYDIIDTDYDSYALVYNCKKSLGVIKSEYAWILSRERMLDANLTNALVQKLKKYTNDVDKLILADQKDC